MFRYVYSSIAVLAVVGLMAAANAQAYYVSTVTNQFAANDIAATGTNVTALWASRDDGNQAVVMPFAFSYFGGAASTTMRICTNGWISPTDTNTTYTMPATLPSTAIPNNFIGGWFRDLDFNFGGIAYVGTIGTAPNRRFVVQYTNVMLYNVAQPSPDSLSIQWVLFEGSNAIEVHYASVVVGANIGGIGLEDAAGTVGFAAPPNWAQTPTNTTAYRWSTTPPLTVAATVGTEQVVLNNAQGTGNAGIAAGTFTISNGATAGTLLSISVAATGTGLDQTDLSYVALWRDANSTSAFEAGGDAIVGTPFTAFPANDGTLVFNIPTAEQAFATNTTIRYFVVVKLAGTAVPGATFKFQVSDLGVGAGTDKAGVPSAIMAGLRTLKPTITAAAVSAPAQNVYSTETGGGAGFAAATFTLAANTEGAPAITAIQLASAGTGDDGAAYSEVAVYRESNATPGFQPADTLIASVAAFTGNDGNANFPVPAAEQAISTGTTRTYYIVIKLNGTALPTQTFNYIINALTPAAGSAIEGVPSVPLNGLVVSTPVFTFADTSAAAEGVAYLGSSGNVCQSFTVAYPGGPDDKPATVTISGLGSANELTDLVGAGLWLDADASGAFETANDTLVSNAAFSADNGVANFSLVSHPNFQAGQTRRYFVVYDLNLAATHNETFKCYVSAATGMSLGGTVAGLPAPGVVGTPGLLVNATLLTAALNGPGLATTVQNNSAGATGSGELLCDVTLTAASGQAWNLTGLTFAAAGSAAHDTAYTDIGLHEDSGNGIWDGSGTDGAAAGTLPGFGAGPGFQATFTLSNGLFNSGASRRFFLVGKLNGTATTGESLNARFEAVVGNIPVGGIQLGMPTADSTALMIDVSVLTIANGPGAPGNVMHKSGTALAFPMAKFRMGASNDAVTVSGISLTATGNGNWPASMDATTGVQVYLDNGDGIFDNVTDTVLYQGPGSASVGASFTPSVVVPTRGTRDVWIRANLLASAGAGASTPQTYSVTVAQATDVSANTGVIIGTPAPNGAILSVVDFFVTSVDPLTDALAGGKILTITGSGFTSPFTVTIGGVVCPGTPAISPTQVTGIQVPQGSGTALPIVVSSGTFAPLTLTQTFEYRNPGNPAGPSTGSGCAAGAAGLLWPVALLLGLRRRRRV